MPCGKPTTRTTTIDGREIEVELHRSPRRRKTFHTRVDDGRVRLIVPKRTTNAEVENILGQKADWISEALRQPDVRLRDQLRDGGSLPLLGLFYPVVVGRGSMPVHFDGTQFLIHPDTEDPEAAARYQFKEVARAYFAERLLEWCDRVEAWPSRLRVAKQKTRWGSVSGKGTLSLNWQLIFAPPELIDYVVVHELCHFHEMNHKYQFWVLLEKHIPDCWERRWALDHLGPSLIW